MSVLDVLLRDPEATADELRLLRGQKFRCEGWIEHANTPDDMLSQLPGAGAAVEVAARPRVCPQVLIEVGQRIARPGALVEVAAGVDDFTGAFTRAWLEHEDVNGQLDPLARRVLGALVGNERVPADARALAAAAISDQPLDVSTRRAVVHLVRSEPGAAGVVLPATPPGASHRDEIVEAATARDGEGRPTQRDAVARFFGSWHTSAQEVIDVCVQARSPKLWQVALRHAGSRATPIAAAALAHAPGRQAIETAVVEQPQVSPDVRREAAICLLGRGPLPGPTRRAVRAALWGTSGAALERVLIAGAAPECSVPEVARWAMARTDRSAAVVDAMLARALAFMGRRAGGRDDPRFEQQVRSILGWVLLSVHASKSARRTARQCLEPIRGQVPLLDVLLDGRRRSALTLAHQVPVQRADAWWFTLAALREAGIASSPAGGHIIDELEPSFVAQGLSLGALLETARDALA